MGTYYILILSRSVHIGALRYFCSGEEEGSKTDGSELDPYIQIVLYIRFVNICRRITHFSRQSGFFFDHFTKINTCGNTVMDRLRTRGTHKKQFNDRIFKVFRTHII